MFYIVYKYMDTRIVGTLGCLTAYMYVNKNFW